MSIANIMRALHRLEVKVEDFQKKYKGNALATTELKKMQSSVHDLQHYLKSLDQLKPHYDTDKIKDLMTALNLHQDILKVELEKKDYAVLHQHIRIISIMLNFHASRYSFLSFIVAWFLELFLFI